MSGIRKFELFTVPQKERPAKLEEVALSFLDQLQTGEYLLIGLPEVIKPWETCTPIIICAEHRQQFLAWVKERTQFIEGPIYNLPPLNASFLCAILTDDYDPRIDGHPENTTKELAGVLASLTAFMNDRDSKAA